MTIRTLGSNTWAVDIDCQRYKVWRSAGADSNDQPKGWVWTVEKWQEPYFVETGYRQAHVHAHWRKLPRGGPKARAVITVVERMLADVRGEG